MKVLLFNGSPRKEGNTHLALQEVAKSLHEDGIDTEEVWIGNKPVRGCIACYKCRDKGRCVFSDELYDELFDRIKECDGIVIGTPVYYAGANGSLCAILDRLFFSGGEYLRGKPAAAIAVARRAGAVAAVDRINKYFEINGMPMPGSQYWNIAFGREDGEVIYDLEGMQTMRLLGHNLAVLLKNPNPMAGREPFVPTNMIRP